MAMFYEPGTYRVKVLEQSMTKTKATQNPMLVLKCRILQVWDQHQEQFFDLNQCYDRTIWLPVDPANESSQERFARKLRHAGWQGHDFKTMNLVGITCEAECRESEYQGKPSESWDLANPGGSNLAENDPGVAKSLNAILGKRMKATPPAPSQVEPQPQESQEQPVADGNDEAIPF